MCKFYKTESARPGSYDLWFLMKGNWWQSLNHRVCLGSGDITCKLRIASLTAYDFGNSDPEVMTVVSECLGCFSFLEIFFDFCVVLSRFMSLEFRPWVRADAQLLTLVSKYCRAFSMEGSLLWKCYVSLGVRGNLAKDIHLLFGRSTCRFISVGPAYADTVHLTIGLVHHFPIGTLFDIPWFSQLDDLSRGYPSVFGVDWKKPWTLVGSLLGRMHVLPH